jgi:hypothetical protein
VRRGQITPAGREHLRCWLARLGSPGDAAFAAEACTGWRYVAARSAPNGPGDARLLRDPLVQGRLPECWIPPEHILECRALNRVAMATGAGAGVVGLVANS